MKNKGALTELEIKNAMREVRVALLEADVNYTVVKEFVNRVSEKAKGELILKGLESSHQVVKIVNDELIELMGSKHAKLETADRPPTVYMMCGLQGAGKTTMCGKLAALLKRDNKKVLLAAGDIYRPAAIKQLQVVGEKAGVEVLYDDREVRPGFMFADADLFGVPVRAVISQKTEERGVIEVSTRDKSIKTEFAVGEAADKIVGLVKEMLAEYDI